MTELKPCPFCGTDDYNVHLQKIDYIAICRARWKVICETCGAEGSEYELPEGAAEAWNRRCGDENAVHMVRCKDCKHWDGDTSYAADRICIAECQKHKTEFNGTITSEVTGENDFCSWGERKDGDAE